MSKIFDELLRVREFDASFLRPEYEDCVEPGLLPDMDKAVERIKLAACKSEKVLIYGDYDVDGVTASMIMHDILRLSGVGEIEVMLPNRFKDGYGMSKKVIQRAQETGVDLVVTVDCGSRNHEIIAELKTAGIETIVSDHHECEDELPEAVAIVNPKRKDARNLVLEGAESAQELKRKERAISELFELSGAGVAFKIAQGLVQAGVIPSGQEKWLLDLVLLGTVCDSMKLTGENRRLCYYGMKVLGKTRRVGLKELMRVAGTRRLGGEAIGFQLGPRLNAAGRMETAEIALDLLLAKSRTEAAELTMTLNQLNEQRRKQQNAAVLEITEQGVGDEPVIVVQGKWHEGVLGIIAGRLVEEYQRPAFVLTEVDGVLKGSGRSFGEFSLAEALAACQAQIIGGGGHAEACGVKLELGKIGEFRAAINEFYRGLELKDQERFLGVREDLEIRDFNDLSLELIEELRSLEPFGSGNPEPVFLLPEVRVVEKTTMGAENEHLRLLVWDQQGKSMKLVQFRAPEEYRKIQVGAVVNIWIQIVENEYRGIRSVEGRILKIGEM